MRTFLPAMCAAFFIRVRPASRKAKPACMNITSTAATTTQRVLAASSRSEFFTPLPPPRAAAGPATRGVGDRCRGVGGEFVSYDEGEQRLRQEARLEDAPAVLVRDPAL